MNHSILLRERVVVTYLISCVLSHKTIRRRKAISDHEER